MLNALTLANLLDPETLAQLTDDADGATPIEEVLNAAIESARAEAALLMGEAALPAIGEHLAALLAIERLFLRRRDMMPADWQHRLDGARDQLTNLGDQQRRRVTAPPDQPAPLHRRETLKDL
jgi:hypothetical protein